MGRMSGGWGNGNNGAWDPTMAASPSQGNAGWGWAPNHPMANVPVHPNAPVAPASAAGAAGNNFGTPLTIDNAGAVTQNIENQAAGHMHPMSLQPYANLYANMYQNMLNKRGITDIEAFEAAHRAPGTPSRSAIPANRPSIPNWTSSPSSAPSGNGMMSAAAAMGAK